MHFNICFCCCLKMISIAYNNWFLIVLNNSWFTTLFNFCCTAKWFNYTHILLFIFFSVTVYLRVLNIVFVLYNTNLLFIYPIYTGLHLKIPNSQSFPPFTSPLTASSVLCIYECVFILQICSFVPCFRFHI